MDRRKYLQMLAGSGAFTGLAGCNSSDDELSASPDSEPTDNPTESPTSTPTSTSTSQPAANPTDTATSTPTSTPESVVFDGSDIQAFVDAVTFLDGDREAKLIIEEDTYRFDPLDAGDPPLRTHARFENIENLTIEGNGATLAFTNPLIAALVFRGGRNITIRNIALDYDPVPFTQGTITGSSNNPQIVDLSLDEGFPTLEHDMFDLSDQVYALVHEPDGSFIRGVQKRGSWDPRITDITKLEAGRYELQINQGFKSGGLTVGRKLTVLARNNMSGLSFDYVDGPTVENVSIHATNGGAFHFTMCKDPVERECTVAPPTDSDRHIGAVADGVRMINCRSSATIEGCHHEAVGDDSVVVQHTLAPVTEILGERTIAVENVHPFVVTTGDILDVLAPTGERKEPLPPVATYESRFPLPSEREKPETITFEAPVVDLLAEGDYLRNRATGSQNFAVRDSEFRNHRANLIRIAASDGVVENNTLEGCSINPIELETDLESQVFAPKGWTSDVTVRNNTVSRAGLDYYAGATPVGIHVHHRPAPNHPSAGKPNRNITIVENEVEAAAMGGIRVEATNDATVEGNTLSKLNQLDFPQFADVGVTLDHVSGATVRNNTARGTANSLDYFGLKLASDDPTISENRLVVDGTTKEGNLVSLRPMTLAFSRTVQPSEVNEDSQDERPLAFRCTEIELVDANETTVLRIDVGRNEDGVSFGDGVWPPSSDGGWRWFGGARESAVLYLADSILSTSTTVRLRGYPIVKGISATVSVTGQQRDTVMFESGETRTYTVDIE
jgi:hypothetical protein